MKIRLIILFLLSYLLTACTSLNSSCNKIAEGSCWPDINHRCGYQNAKQYNLEACKHSDWYCGYRFDFGDP